MSEGPPKRQALEAEYRELQLAWRQELLGEHPDWERLDQLNERLEDVEMQLDEMDLDEWL
jgi:hypothetical protein